MLFINYSCSPLAYFVTKSSGDKVLRIFWSSITGRQNSWERVTIVKCTGCVKLILEIVLYVLYTHSVNLVFQASWLAHQLEIIITEHYSLTKESIMSDPNMHFEIWLFVSISKQCWFCIKLFSTVHIAIVLVLQHGDTSWILLK